MLMHSILILEQDIWLNVRVCKSRGKILSIDLLFPLWKHAHGLKVLQVGYIKINYWHLMLNPSIKPPSARLNDNFSGSTSFSFIDLDLLNQMKVKLHKCSVRNGKLMGDLSHQDFSHQASHMSLHRIKSGQPIGGMGGITWHGCHIPHGVRIIMSS